ncbi:hypothetical protein LINGRAHAP2_LOCUS18863 [Linum grandiflorum]
MMVVVEILSGSLFHVKVKEDGTVGDLRRAISDQQKLPINRLILLQLDENNNTARIITSGHDDLPLAQFDIHDGSLVYLFFTYLNGSS